MKKQLNEKEKQLTWGDLLQGQSEASSAFCMALLQADNVTYSKVMASCSGNMENPVPKEVLEKLL